MKRLREKGKNSQFALLVLFAMLSIGTVAALLYQPSGFRACVGSKTRDFLADYLVSKGFGLECRKEGDVSSMTYFGLRNFNQFIWWAGNQSIPTIYEQPGYFWFLRTDAVPGLVSYEY